MLKFLVKGTFLFIEGKRFILGGESLEGAFEFGMMLQDSNSELFKIVGTDWGENGARGLMFKYKSDEDIKTLRATFQEGQIFNFV